MVRPPDASFAEGAWPQAQSENLEGPVGDLFSSTKQVMRGTATGIAEYGQTDPESGRQLSEPEEKVAPDVLNKQYGIPGKLTFNDAIPDSVARSMYETHIDAIKQQDIANRAPPGFVNGAVRLGAQFAVGFLDPLQLGATMVPVVPEIELGTSLAARVGGKALAQGAGGLVATAPLVGLQYGLSRQEQSDFTAYDAMFELAQGAGFGAGIGALEAGGSALGAEMSRRYKASRGRQVSDADPAVRTGSAQTAISQLEQENPVEVRPVYDQSDTPNVPEEAGYGATQPIGQARSTAFLPENEPKGLTSFLQQDFTVGRPGDVNSERRAGGLTDPGGDLDAIIGGPRGRPGLINNESGSSLSEAANRAHEAGYFDHVPDDNELLDAIAKDHNRTNPNDAIYSNRDQDAADDYRYARQRNVEIDQMSAQTGIPTEGLTHEQFWDQVADHVSQEQAFGEVSRLEQEHADAFEQAEQAAHAWMAEGESRPSAEELYRGAPHTLEDMEHEWKQAEAANPVLPGEGGGGQSGPASEPAGDVQTGDGQVSGSPGAAGRAGPEERSQILQSALRDASGQRPPDPTSLAAERALKEGTEKNLLKLAQQDIEDHEEFFRRASQAALSRDGVVISDKMVAGQVPRVRFEQDAARIEASLPEPPEGYERLWRGNRPGEVGTARQFTNDLAGIALPFREGYRGDISYVDVPIDRLDEYLNKTGGAPGAEFLVPSETAATATPVKTRLASESPDETVAGHYAGLTADVRAELDAINGLDKEASDLVAAAKQAAACIARGVGGMA